MIISRQLSCSSISRSPKMTAPRCADSVVVCMFQSWRRWGIIVVAIPRRQVHQIVEDDAQGFCQRNHRLGTYWSPLQILYARVVSMLILAIVKGERRPIKAVKTLQEEIMTFTTHPRCRGSSASDMVPATGRS